MRFWPRTPHWNLICGIAAGVLLAVITSNFLPSEKKIEHQIYPAYSVDDPQFLRTMGALFGPPLVDGNSAVELLNGDEIFPPMLAAIRSAQHTITFETFIYWSGKIGREFATALSERARAGVKVHVLLDYIGTKKMEDTLLEQMRSAGCEMVKFHPPTVRHWSEFNNRTHRKLLIVDGRVGFTGGVGIGDEWLGHAQDANHWRDTHFKVTGPVVAQMQAVFMANWMKTKARVDHTEEYFPALEPTGKLRAQMFHSSPEEGSENVRLMYLLSIAAARRVILLEQAYFVPDELATHMLADAARRGVRVEIIVPGPLTDTKFVRRASRAGWGELLRAGVKFYEFQPTNFHCKVMVVDGRWSSVGSTNFDNRSFRLNDEANLNIYDAGFAAKLEQTFAADKQRSREVTFEAWRNRPWTIKLWEKFWQLFGSQF